MTHVHGIGNFVVLFVILFILNTHGIIGVVDRIDGIIGVDGSTEDGSCW